MGCTSYDMTSALVFNDKNMRDQNKSQVALCLK
jgi:hypothetical protein